MPPFLQNTHHQFSAHSGYYNRVCLSCLKLMQAVALPQAYPVFQTVFMDFAVFNVADCCITIGVPLLFLYVWFYVGKDEKKEGKADDAAQLPPDGT